MSAREGRAARDAHAAAATRSRTKTPESFLVGVGASGALLAGAAIAFISLVGMVSFDVWPSSLDSTPGNQVDLGTAIAQAQPNAKAPVAPVGGDGASFVESGTAAPAPAAGGGGGKPRGGRRPVGSSPALVPNTPPPASEPAGPGGSQGNGNQGNGGGNAGGGGGQGGGGTGAGNGNGNASGNSSERPRGGGGGQSSVRPQGSGGGKSKDKATGNGKGGGKSSSKATTVVLDSGGAPEHGNGNGNGHANGHGNGRG